MAITTKVYGHAPMHFANKDIDWDTDAIYVALLKNTYTPDYANHESWNDVKAQEVSGTGYTANGLALASLARNYDGGNLRTKLAAANASWNPSTITARYAVVYTRTPSTDATRWLIQLFDFGADQSSSGTPFTLQFDALGLSKWECV
jgi:hypothetical protein